ncbi:MAG: class II aldolase/adducin family protein [Alphaproteobacteria bacterium]|nr:class II aldolase/adducin family protein [Alphaproteobacteria bacterium]
MINQAALKNFSQMSKNVGQYTAYVQGGGGNTSVKDGDHMAIKASGYMLSDVEPDAGYCLTNFQTIRQNIAQAALDNNPDTDLTEGAMDKGQNLPSLETGFHALLDTYVLHSHSIYANILTCAVEGKNIAQTLFPNSVWIPYASPGNHLSLAVYKALQADSIDPSIVFLENHGIIISGKTSDQTEQLHTHVNGQICKHFKQDLNLMLHEYDPDTPLPSRQQVLFPDQIVYTIAASESLLKTKAARDTLASYEFIVSSIQTHNLQTKYLNEYEVNFVANMEQEKYRKKFAK